MSEQQPAENGLPQWPCKHWTLGGPTRCDKCTVAPKACPMDDPSVHQCPVQACWDALTCTRAIPPTEHVEEVTDPDTGIVYVPGEGRLP